MRRMQSYLFFIIFALLFAACSVQENSQSTSLSSTAVENSGLQTNGPDQKGVMAPASVPLIDYSAATKGLTRAGESPSTLTPDSMTVTLKPGESVSEHKTAVISGAPPKGDIIFSFDTTGSMYSVLNNAKVNSINIMNKIKSVIPDMYFAVMSHSDYTNTYSGGGYGPILYGYPGEDYPYSLDQSLTDNTTVVSNAFYHMKTGYSYDAPADYTRIMFESYSDSNVGWRNGSKKYLMMWCDDLTHDLDYMLDGSHRSTGPDPGRDEIAGTADDLNLANVLLTMKASNVNLLVMHSGNYFPIWQKYAATNGGYAFKINPNGSIPSGQDIGDFIAEKILDTFMTIRSVSLKVVTPGFESWLTYASPEEITDIDLRATNTFDFDIQITVPAGTPDGVYTFDVGVVGDGVIYATQKVTINVVTKIEVAVDIKPYKIPNYIYVDIDDHDIDHDCDFVNDCDNDISRCQIVIDNHGVIPVAICGTSNFNVRTIDVRTVQLAGVSPVFSWYHDVATPYYPFIDKPLDKMAGNKLGRDGYLDLVMLFKNKDIVKALGDVEDEEVLILKLFGKTLDGRDIVGEDVICVIDPELHHNCGHYHNNHFIRWCPNHNCH